MKLINFQHLKQVEESYWQHFKFATWAGFYLVYLGVVSLVHGVFPFFAARYPDQLFQKFLEKSKSRLNRVSTCLKEKGIE